MQQFPRNHSHFFYTHTNQIARKTVKTCFREEKAWLNRGHFVCFVAAGETSLKEWRSKSVMRTEGKQVAGGESSGCYFLALAALAEFRGGVTGLPDPIPPAPL